MSDIRDSGQIEQDSDLVMMLQWLNRDVEYFRVWCIKRRNGGIKEQMVSINFNASRQTFYDNSPKA